MGRRATAGVENRPCPRPCPRLFGIGNPELGTAGGLSRDPAVALAQSPSILYPVVGSQCPGASFVSRPRRSQSLSQTQFGILVPGCSLLFSGGPEARPAFRPAPRYCDLAAARPGTRPPKPFVALAKKGRRRMPLLRLSALSGNLHATGMGRQAHPPTEVSALREARDNAGAAGRGVSKPGRRVLTQRLLCCYPSPPTHY